MFRKTFAPALIATLLASAAFAAPSVKSVDVAVDLAAIENPAAAAYWTNVAEDLENAIVARLTDNIKDDGVDIDIDISEVELANTFENVMNIAETRMVAQVNVTSATDNTQFNSYELTVKVEEAMQFFPEGTVITAVNLDGTEYYTAMVEAFAQSVVDRLDD
ncbi:MAG: hypothetical protein V4804_11255 [Pseudomonadota bacterium]|jgi:hypothetical protein